MKTNWWTNPNNGVKIKKMYSQSELWVVASLLDFY